MRKYTPLMCKDCPTEIFIDVNMVMIKDELWNSICDDHKDAYCDCCIEKRLGRKIVPADFKGASGGRDIIPCNYMWLHERKKQTNKCAYCGSSETHSGPETGGWIACSGCGAI